MSIRNTNLALRFLLELCALIALAYWGFRTGRGTLAEIGLGLGAPLLAAIVWGTAVAPRATVRLPEPIRFLLGLAILGLAAAALAAGQPALAAAFAAIVAINAVLLIVWGQRAGSTAAPKPGLGGGRRDGA